MRGGGRGGDRGRGRGRGAAGAGAGGGFAGVKRPRSDGDGNDDRRGGSGASPFGGPRMERSEGGDGGRGGGRGFGGRGFGDRGGGRGGGRGSNNSGGGRAWTPFAPAPEPADAASIADAIAGRGTASAAPPRVATNPNAAVPDADHASVVVILAKAGLWTVATGLADAYATSASTKEGNPALEGARPDIVHQCLLALFDSEMGNSGRLRVFIETTRGKTIEVSPHLRPPRTYVRFCGLMETLFRDGSVTTPDGGEALLRVMRGTAAPVVPYGAEVVGIGNDASAVVRSALRVSQDALASPVPNSLQGGTKDVAGFFVVACTDDGDIRDMDLVTKHVCFNEYPATSHVLCSRLCEGFARARKMRAAAASGPVAGASS